MVQSSDNTWCADVAVIGGGMAGILTALYLAPRNVLLLSKSTACSSELAQGGIAAVVSNLDTTANHLKDTIAAGDGLVDENAASVLVKEGAERILDLVKFGVNFDRNQHGDFALNKEGAHSKNRILRASGDSTGSEVMRALRKAVYDSSSIKVVENFYATDLKVSNGNINGITGIFNNKICQIKANAVVLATGGTGHVYLKTTNPTEAYGEGLAMAARAGAMLSDLEFVQFHPTAINIDKDPLPLATEALRGEGAVIINEFGERFLSNLPKAELSARDVIAREILKQLQSGKKIFLDCRKAVGERFPSHFPTVYGYCKDAGINPVKELIPVAPVAHYHMGGVAVDIHGKTSLENLWACGEVSSTGVHGANRLASNSLLEAAVFAKRVATNIAEHTPVLKKIDYPAETVGVCITSETSACENQIRKIMYDNFGIIKNCKKMLKALSELEKLKPDTPREKNMLTTARMIALFSLKRKESRGAHFREDYPMKSNTPKREFMTLYEIETFRKTII